MNGWIEENMNCNNVRFKDVCTKFSVFETTLKNTAYTSLERFGNQWNPAYDASNCEQKDVSEVDYIDTKIQI
jgi:hypothetical protein